jgi:hypothetical protein
MYKPIAAIALAIVTGGCGSAMDQNVEQERVGGAALADASTSLARSRIFFAHQSVGENIVEGVRALQDENRAHSLHVIDLSAAEGTLDSFFAHARLGQNGDPKGKTDAFVSTLEGGLGHRVDVAFQKYCFVDIDAGTNVTELFEYYRGAMNRLHKEFPPLRIVHVTAPLVHVQSGPKAGIKKLLGRSPDHYDDNIARERFNTLMRREYEGREPVFDLAAIEARGPDGSPRPLRFRGADVFELLPEYTTDGAHLNDGAERRVAAELLAFLGSVIADRGPQVSQAAR